jgi:hypothetical protein
MEASYRICFPGLDDGFLESGGKTDLFSGGFG